MPSYHLIITGKVQGVFYRATAKDVAIKLGITGWIKNTAEGNVEATIRGSEEQANEFIKWCRQGPRSAKVKDVIVSEIGEALFSDFSISH